MKILLVTNVTDRQQNRNGVTHKSIHHYAKSFNLQKVTKKQRSGCRDHIEGNNHL